MNESGRSLANSVMAGCKARAMTDLDVMPAANRPVIASAIEK